MCGLFGWDLSRAPSVRAVASLAYANEARGKQSCGWMTDTGVARYVAPVTDYIAPLAKLRRVAVHTRHATHGSLCERNAHPFEVGGVTLMHNGVLWAHEALNERYGRQCQVDSEHLAWHLAAGLPLNEIEGYGTIVWSERGQPGFFLCKLTDGADLAVARVKGGIVWSSEAEPISYGFRRPVWVRVDTGVVLRVMGGEVYATQRRLTLDERVRDWRLGWDADDVEGVDSEWCDIQSGASGELECACGHDVAAHDLEWDALGAPIVTCCAECELDEACTRDADRDADRYLLADRAERGS